MFQQVFVVVGRAKNVFKISQISVMKFSCTVKMSWFYLLSLPLKIAFNVNRNEAVDPI